MASRKAQKRRKQHEPLVRAGQPARDAVREVVTKVSPSGMRFRILKTTEMDSYDEPRRVRKGGK